MILFRHLFRLREKMQTVFSPAEEMPFPDHLEALRRTIIRMAVTLVVSMLLCFGFSDTFMQVLRYPVEQVRMTHENAALPPEISAADWSAACELAELRSMTADVSAPEAALPPIVVQAADAVPLLRAAAFLPQEEREAYLTAHAPDPEIARLANSLLHSGAVPKQSSAAPRLMSAFQPGEAFMLSLQLAFFSGLVVSFPLLLLFALQFIVPGLLENERRLLWRVLLFGGILFIAGCAFGYGIILPRVLGFFYTYSVGMGIENDWRISYYLVFTAKLVFVTGAVFELPVIILPLIRLGLLHYDLMKRTRAYALVACFAAALLLAPSPDPGTMVIMALPMYLLYESCILFARFQCSR